MNSSNKSEWISICINWKVMSEIPWLEYVSILLLVICFLSWCTTLTPAIVYSMWCASNFLCLVFFFLLGQGLLRSCAAQVQTSIWMLVQQVSGESKAHWDSATRQGPVDLGQYRILLGPCSLHALFSLLISMILLEIFSFTLSVTHGTDVFIPGNLLFSRIFPVKSFGSWCFSAFLSGGATYYTPDPSSCSDSVLTRSPLLCKQILN